MTPITSGIELLEINDFLDRSACDALRAELIAAGGGPATVSGAAGAVQPQMRRVTRAAMPAATRERVTRLLMARKAELERHFSVALSRCEEPQFLRYQAGDFFVAHQDGNTPLIHDDTRFRKVSAIIALSAQSEAPQPDCYGGGALVFHGPYAGPQLRVPVAPAPGTLICFRAETTHEVLPVTRGERVSIVSWFR
jgi:predicted 2-oxoglutarate/Fe(II)-dependent dioxygenase YbiX